MRFLEQENASNVVKELHDDPAGGHFSGDTTTHKILRTGYYWPTLFKDARAYVTKFDICHRSSGRLAKVVGPLQLVFISKLFKQWGIDIIGEINPNYSL